MAPRKGSGLFPVRLDIRASLEVSVALAGEAQRLGMTEADARRLALTYGVERLAKLRTPKAGGRHG